MMFQMCIVIPCFNEENRLDTSSFNNFLSSNDDVCIVFVDDGSVDKTFEVVSAMRQLRPEKIFSLKLEKNVGKGNAIHSGFCYALQNIDFDYWGYMDADLSAPLESLADFADVFSCNPQVDMVTGCRLKRLGADVQRSTARHYVGRIFATVVSLVLSLPVYDSQCGAKLFRKSLAVQIFNQKFYSRWIFDVEIFMRALLLDSRTGTESMYELPLRKWHAKQGSKVKLSVYVRSCLDLFKLAILYHFLPSRILHK